MSEYPGLELSDQAEMHRMKALAPASHLPLFSGKINNHQLVPLTSMIVLGNLMDKEHDLVNAKTDGKDADKIIADLVSEYPRVFISLTGSVEGFRSKQLTGVSISNNAPAPMGAQIGDKKPNWFERNILRRKPEQIAGN